MPNEGSDPSAVNLVYWEGVEEYVPGYHPSRATRLLRQTGWQPGRTACSSRSPNR